jgi:hypothetical protein
MGVQWLRRRLGCRWLLRKQRPRQGVVGLEQRGEEQFRLVLLLLGLSLALLEYCREVCETKGGDCSVICAGTGLDSL